jgi:hypothetical protein
MRRDQADRPSSRSSRLAKWCDPEYQEGRRAELARDQERSADYHEQAAREQEARKNRELKEQFLAHQPRH